VPVSAAVGDGVEELRAVLLSHLPEGPALFPDGEITDQPLEVRLTELVREQALVVTREEVPHSVAVSVDKWEETPKITRIYATIRVERDGQKAIVIGAGASMLKQIGTQARHEMEKMFERKIYLDLHVRVQPGWRQDRAFLNTLDWRTMTGEDDI